MDAFLKIYDEVRPEKELFFELGRALIKQDKFRKAIEMLQEALLIPDPKPEAWEIYFYLGEGYRNLNKPKDAFENYIEAAIHTNEYKTDFYEEARKLINPSTQKDLLDFLELRNKKNDASDLSETDKKELKNLSKLISNISKQNEEAETLELAVKNDIQILVDDSNTLILQNDFKNALDKIEQALTKESGNYDILFIKIRILIEGQMDLIGASVLFNDEDFGYRKENDDTSILNKLNNLLKENPERGNTWFFAALLGHLIHLDLNLLNSWVEKAESLGLINDNTYPEIGLYLLKGDIAEKKGQKEEAGNHFFEAAKRYYWQGKFSDAEKYFGHSTELNPSFNDGFKYDADTLFILSYQNEPPNYNEKLLTKAYETWHRSAETTVQNAKDAWFYIIIARIHEVLHKFKETGFFEEYWQAVLYAERALIHDQKDYSLWTYLGRFYINLDLESNSKAAFEIAEKLNADNDFLREERTILQLNIGDYEGPTTYLDQLQKQEEEKIREGQSNPNIYKYYHKSWRGYILFQTGHRTEAARIFEDIIKESNTDLFSHRMLMFCFWYQNNLPEAKAEANRIIELGNKYIYLKEDYSFSWAHLISGQPEKAIAILKSVTEKGGITRDNAFSLFQFYLFTGENTLARENFEWFIKSEHNSRFLNELLTSLSALEYQYSQQKPELYSSANDYKDQTKEYKQLVNDRIEIVRNSTLQPKDELFNKLAQQQFIPGSLPFIAIQAGLARFNRTEKHLSDAYRIYKSLLKYESLIPEAKLALSEIEEEAISASRTFLKKSDYYSVLDHLVQIDNQETANASLLHVFLSIAYFGIQDHVKSLEHLEALFKLSTNKDEPYQQAWAEMTERAYIPDLTWNFGHFIKTNIHKLDIPDTGKFLSTMNEYFWNVLINKGSDLYPLHTQCAIEISNDLVTSEADATDWYVITKLIPGARNRIEQKYGVKIPSVRIRINDGDLPYNSYIIMLDEIPIVMGYAQKGQLFIPGDEKELASLNITGGKGWNPITGEDSLWVLPEYKDQLNEQGILYWEDHFDYIIAHMERLLSQNLDMFIDPQVSNDYLWNYAEGKEKNVSEMITEITQNPSLLFSFNQVLKGLVKENIPIINKEVIIHSFIEAGKNVTEVNDKIRYIRSAIKSELPVNIIPAVHVELPIETENKIKSELVNEQGKTFLAMTPENCQDALSEIRNLIGKNVNQDVMALIINDSQLRIHIRKLVELEFPTLIVASRDELIASK